jgi:hypothetical protein
MSDFLTGPGVERLWWIDPQKAQKLSQAMADESIQLEVGETENRYWLGSARTGPEKSD